jgi:hypothetical protein
LACRNEQHDDQHLITLGGRAPHREFAPIWIVHFLAGFTPLSSTSTFSLVKGSIGGSSNLDEDMAFSDKDWRSSVHFGILLRARFLELTTAGPTKTP